jgi:chorismate mutase
MLPPDAVRTIRRQLELRLAQLNQEIREYPQPIARCDAQLAGLIQERADVAQALEALDGA